jgi:ABC-type transporter Mla subunit MlaD
MSLTLNQFLLLILTFAAVVAVTFLSMFLAQLRKTAKEGEKTLVEVRSLVDNLNITSRQVNDQIENLGEVVEASKKVAGNLSEASMLFSSRFVRPAARYWPILFPLIRMGMRLLKNKKEVKNGR